MVRMTLNMLSSWKKFIWMPLSFLILLTKKVWDEQKFITEFTEHVMIRESGVYTLLGPKPMTFINMSYTRPTKKQRLSLWNDYPEEIKQEYKPKDIFFPSYDAQRLLAKWRTVDEEITKDTYRFIELPHHELLFINIPLCIKIISEHRALFSSLLEADLPPEELAKNLAAKSSLLREKLLENHLLTGLLCGFGLENASQFHICTHQGKKCSTPSSSPTDVFIKDHPKLSEINIPLFNVFPGGEEVVARYKSEREAILAAHSDKNFKKFALKMLKKKQAARSASLSQ